MLEILNIINIIHSSKEFWKNIGLRSRCIVSLPGLHDAPIFYCGFMKDIPGYEGRYAVTEDGKVWSHNRIKKYKRNGFSRSDILYGKFLKQTITQYGYKSVRIGKKCGERFHAFLVHRLVGMTYIPNPENKPHINHKNGIRDDNRIENLEWCTNSENHHHRIHVLKTGMTAEQYKKYGEMSRIRISKRIGAFDDEGNLIREFSSIKCAAKEMHLGPYSISLAYRGKQEKAGGFIWKLINN